jgi:hypothetical protein
VRVKLGCVDCQAGFVTRPVPGDATPGWRCAIETPCLGDLLISHRTFPETEQSVMLTTKPRGAHLCGREPGGRLYCALALALARA